MTPDELPDGAARRHQALSYFSAAGERVSRSVLKKKPQRYVSRTVQMPGKRDRAA
ncbi:hypothetical protein HPX85_004265 [Salmonella enterica]|nr:hypothetical protein [Salmonella enterica]